MKNKRLIIILSVFMVLVLIAILCSTVFTVKKVSLNWLTTKVNFDISDDDVAGDVKKGDSVFLVDKASIMSTLEAKYPYLKVVSVEVKFPNRLVLHTAERKEVFLIKITDNKYAILDEDSKVLNIINDAQLTTMSIKPITVRVLGKAMESEDFIVSDIANIGFVKSVLNDFYVALMEQNYNEINDAKNNFINFEIDIRQNKNLINITTLGGVKLTIEKVSIDLKQKLAYAIKFYDNLEDKTTGEVTVYKAGNTIKCEYSQ